MTATVQFIVLGLMALLGLVGGGLGWWYGTTTFYARTVYGDTTPRPMSRGRLVRRHIRRVFLTLLGAVGGALVPIVGVMLLKR